MRLQWGVFQVISNIGKRFVHSKKQNEYFTLNPDQYWAKHNRR